MLCIQNAAFTNFQSKDLRLKWDYLIKDTHKHYKSEKNTIFKATHAIICVNFELR